MIYVICSQSKEGKCESEDCYHFKEHVNIKVCLDETCNRSGTRVESYCKCIEFISEKEMEI